MRTRESKMQDIVNAAADLIEPLESMLEEATYTTAHARKTANVIKELDILKAALGRWER